MKGNPTGRGGKSTGSFELPSGIKEEEDKDYSGSSSLISEVKEGFNTKMSSSRPMSVKEGRKSAPPRKEDLAMDSSLHTLLGEVNCSRIE